VRSTVQGSVALHCAAHARCPVVVVHGEPPAPGAPVVCGLDDTPVARAALRRAAAEAFRRAAPLRVVTVLHVPDSWGDLFAAPVPRLRAERRCSEAVEEALAEAGRARPDDVRVEVVEGIASEVLVARAAGAALLVVGSRSRSRLEGMLLGSVALRCAVDAPCPVMVVPPAPEAAAG
jgi:nucleotide-binding universal stress UspA family protein